MEPIDYEKFIISNRTEIDKDPLKHLLYFPIDDIEIVEINKKFSTVEHPKPESDENNLHVNEFISNYNSNFKSVTKNYRKYCTNNLTQSKRREFAKIAKSCDIQEFEIDLGSLHKAEFLNCNDSNDPQTFNGQTKNQRGSWLLSDLEKLEPDSILTNLFERMPIENLDRENEIMREKYRPVSLFNFYPSQQQNNSLLVENRTNPDAPQEHTSCKLLVKCTHLKFDLEIEPIWASMALYDLKEKKKISENFYFDLNNESLKQMVGSHQSSQDKSSLAKTCIFNLTYPSSDVYLVVRIEKVLQQGDIGECAEPYVKAQQQSSSSIEKLQTNASQFCERLGKYRMPFVWTAINIMNILNNNSQCSNGAHADVNGLSSNTYAENRDQPPSAATLKSSSLDRRGVAQLNVKNPSTPASSSSSSSSSSYGLKNAYESFRKVTTSNTISSPPGAASRDESATRRSNSIKETAKQSCTNTSQANNFQPNDSPHQSLNNSLNSFKPVAISINTFFKQESDKLSDEDLFRCLNDLKKSTNLIKKLKCLPGCLKMEFSPFNLDLFMNQNSQANTANYLNTFNNYYILNSELQEVKFFNNQPDKQPYHQSLLLHNNLLPIKDILEFPSQPNYEPNYLYQNLLYIYPLAINLCGAGSSKAASTMPTGLSSASSNAQSIGGSLVSSSLSAAAAAAAQTTAASSSSSSSSSSSFLNSSSARNIAIKVNLMKGEDESTCALPMIFAKSSSCAELAKEVFVNVVYHNKTPQYHDEVKVKLPARLTGSNYHLLFTFYHISCQNSKDQPDTIIGYSWLPLHQQFQYETTIYFTNQTSSPSVHNNPQFNSVITDPMSNPAAASCVSSQLGNVLPPGAKIGSQQTSNRCNMIKSGIYSLPISFEKLPVGYSSLNYSTFENTNTNNAVGFFLQTGANSSSDQSVNQMSTENGLLNVDFVAGREDKISLNNVIHVNTLITNVNSLSSNVGFSSSTAATGMSSNTSTNIGLGYSKSNFDVKLKLVSTIHSQDVYLERFFSVAANLIKGQQPYNAQNESILRHAMNDLCYVDLETLIQFLHIILDKLMIIMVNVAYQNVSTFCFEIITRLVQKITNLLAAKNDAHRRNRLLLQYVRYTCNFPYECPSKLFHEELLNQWIGCLTKKATHDQVVFKDVLLKSSWFFFELLYKSTSLYLNLKTNSLMCKTNNLSNYKHNLLTHSNQTLNTYCTKQLSQKFLADLDRLVKLVTTEIVHVQTSQINKVSQSMRSCNQFHINVDSLRSLEQTTSLVNCWLAFFIQDLFSFIDRGYLFKMIDFYVKETNKSISSLNGQLKNLHKTNNSKQNKLKYCIYNCIRIYNSIQLDFLRIVSSYEHFLTLNLPIFPDLNELNDRLKKQQQQQSQQQNQQPCFSNDLFKTSKLIIESKEYFHRHYLVGLICRQVFKSLHSPLASIQYKAVQLLRNLLESHDLDARLSNEKTRSRIAYLYFPFVNLILHFIPFLISSLPYKNTTFAACDDVDSELVNLTQPEFDAKFGPFLHEPSVSDDKQQRPDNEGELLVNDAENSFEIDDYFFDDYDLNFLIDANNRIDELEGSSSSVFSFYPMFDNFKLDEDVLDGNKEELLNYININGGSSSSTATTNDNLYQQQTLGSNTKLTGKKRSSNMVNVKKSQILAPNQQTQQQQHQHNGHSQQSHTKELKNIENSVFNFLSRKHCICANLFHNKTGGKVGSECASRRYSLTIAQDLLVSFMWILKNIDKNLLFNIWSNWSFQKLNKILILIDLCINHFEYRSSVWASSILTNTFESVLQQKKASASTLASSTSTSSSSSSNSKLKNKIEDFIIGTQNSRNEISRRNKYFSYTSLNPANVNEVNEKMNAIDLNDYKPVMKLRKDLNNHHTEMDYTTIESMKLILEGNLSTECVLIGLDTIELIIKIIQHQQQQHFNSQTSSIALNNIMSPSTLLSGSWSTSYHYNISDSINMSQILLTNVMKIMLNALGLEQSTTSLTNLFCHQRSLVSKFPEILFEEDTEYCADMCMRLLKHCTSPLPSVRSQASASLYFLMRQNFDIGNNFSRVKMQVTMSLSTLVAGTKMNAYDKSQNILTTNNSNNSNNNNNNNIDLSINSGLFMDFINVNCLKRSLKTILFYSENDVELNESSFPAQVKDLVLNLNNILSDTVKMREYSDDPEMLIDLMHRIANCYQNSPDMRLIWLQNMAQKHLQHQNLVEAGQCLIHAAALVAEYLSMIENRPYLPVGCASFKYVSVNVLEESAVSDDVLPSPYEEGICTGKYFTENGLIGLIEQAAVFLMHSQNYEVANQLYKILIPIYESHRDIKKLSQVHSKLHDCFNKILINSNKRLFGTYFRVGFYGDRFEDLNGQEFIYKEPGITKLAEIANRLESFYTSKFGAGVVEIMKDSNNVDKNNIDVVAKAYIQITYVEPYFDRWEQQKFETFFEKNYSLKRFIYSTPFTLDGKAHGPLNQQYKRKTILTTERAFPYVKTRIPVIDKQQIILGPVEVAIEDLQKKIDELKNATNQDPADPKILQMVLQGCVGTTVNQGPLEMALTFLQPVSSESITEHHNKLRLCFKEFSRRCCDALKKNKSLIGSDQFEYQKEMEKNYNDLKTKIDPLIENKLFKNQIYSKSSKPVEP